MDGGYRRACRQLIGWGSPQIHDNQESEQCKKPEQLSAQSEFQTTEVRKFQGSRVTSTLEPWILIRIDQRIG